MYPRVTMPGEERPDGFHSPLGAVEPTVELAVDRYRTKSPGRQPTSEWRSSTLRTGERIAGGLGGLD